MKRRHWENLGVVALTIVLVALSLAGIGAVLWLPAFVIQQALSVFGTHVDIIQAGCLGWGAFFAGGVLRTAFGGRRG
jgi:hypothetical protein